MSSNHVNAVVVGAGAGGGIVAKELATSGLSVVLFERGRWQSFDDHDHDELISQRVTVLGNAFGPDDEGNPRVVKVGETWRTLLPSESGYSNNAACVGGGTLSYGAMAWRFSEQDFRMRTIYGRPDGSTLDDWPITYDDLEPCYEKAEYEIGVAGEATNPFAAPRKTPFPMPPFPYNGEGRMLEAAAKRLGLHPFPIPMLRNSVPRDGRAACIGCRYCVGFACEVQAKCGTQNTVIPKAMATGHCTVLPESVVKEVLTDEKGRATGVAYFDKDGRLNTQTADLVVVSAAAIESARLLLNSKSKLFPAGLGNRHDWLGRNLQGHAYCGAWGLFEDEVYDDQGAGATVGYYAGSSYSGDYCTTCHQIQASYDMWAQSVHRNMDCKECHGSAFTLDLDAHATNLRHLYYQAGGRIPGRIVLKDGQVDRIAANCARCHMDKASQWKAGGHSVGYSHIFLSENRNRKTLLMDDCLRCHGMFADGNVTSIVTPVDNKGPWKLVNPAFSKRPTIPCLACHSMHSRGTPAASPDYLVPKSISYGRVARTTSLAFYDRRERRHFPIAELPLPVMYAQGRAVKMSPDTRQAVCYQCHAPEAVHSVGTGDDRTAIGVHEGIGCLGCHDAHTLDARASCADCHPSMSNCGLDVATMDTTFKAATSTHNVHRVACRDCHTKGVPKSKRQQAREARVSGAVSPMQVP